ncbi:MAG: hypothetical protein IKJ33_05505 [Clostridia bacterium]|nr:hypothetical protein [Clostridia bacterium]
MVDKIEHSANENYNDYIKSFIKTKDTFYRKIPNMRGVKDFDFVDEGTKDNEFVNMLSGYSVKYCVRANVMLLRDLIREIKSNPNCSYQTCYTNKEIINDDIPEYFSVFMKEPDSLFAVEADVFASRILNYFGLPVAYNRRIDKATRHYGTTKYVMSVDMIRKNEKLVLLSDIVPFKAHIDIGKFNRNGLKDTLEFIGEYLKIYLEKEGIGYTEKDIEEYKKYLAMSVLERYMLMADTDFRNGNTGILIDTKNKSFRALPNFDMEKCFGTIANESRFDDLKSFYELYPEDYDEFISKMFNLFKEPEKGESLDVKIARKSVRNESVANAMLFEMYNSAGEIWRETEKFKKRLVPNGNNEKANEILA